MKVLIAGGSGFIGHAIARVFKQAQPQMHITGVSRTKISSPWFDDYQQQSLQEGCHFSETFDVVINAAGPTNIWQDKAQLRAGHLDSNHHLLSGARCRQYVYISSSSVYMATHDRLRVREDQVSEPFFNEYGRVKREAELATIALRKSEPYYIIRPRMVLGQGDTAWFPHLLKHLQKPILFAPEAGILVQPTPVDYLARAILHLLQREAAAGIYNVAQPEALPYVELIALMEKYWIKRPGFKITWPRALGQWLIRQKFMRNSPSADLLFNVSCSLTFDCSKLAATGFREPVPDLGEVLQSYRYGEEA